MPPKINLRLQSPRSLPISTAEDLRYASSETVAFQPKLKPLTLLHQENNTEHAHAKTTTTYFFLN